MIGERVNVLRVLDDEIARAGGEAYLAGRNLTEVRYAVAELIEADKEYDDARTAVETRDPWLKKLARATAMFDRFEYAKKRRAAALSRIQPDGQG